MSGQNGVPLPATTPPAMDGIASIGVLPTYACADHTHPSDLSRAVQAQGAFANTVAGFNALRQVGSLILDASLTLVGGVLSVTPTTTVRVVTAGTSVATYPTDRTVFVNKTAGSPTSIVLLSIAPAGMTLTIKDSKGDAATNPITVTTAAGTIDGAASVVINTAYGHDNFIYNGTSWGLV